MIVKDTLGRTREVAKVYPDGSYNCPFCMAAVMAGTPANIAHACPNPGCYARGGEGMPPFPPERARQDIAFAEGRESEERQRKEARESGMRYAETRRVEEAERTNQIRVEALARGACPECAIESARFSRPVKYVKHKKSCPRSRR